MNCDGKERMECELWIMDTMETMKEIIVFTMQLMFISIGIP